jgi:hypothetical protein
MPKPTIVLPGGRRAVHPGADLDAQDQAGLSDLASSSEGMRVGEAGRERGRAGDRPQPAGVERVSRLGRAGHLIQGCRHLAGAIAARAAAGQDPSAVNRPPAPAAVAAQEFPEPGRDDPGFLERAAAGAGIADHGLPHDLAPAAHDDRDRPLTGTSLRVDQPVAKAGGAPHYDNEDRHQNCQLILPRRDSRSAVLRGRT